MRVPPRDRYLSAAAITMTFVAMSVVGMRVWSATGTERGDFPSIHEWRTYHTSGVTLGVTDAPVKIVVWFDYTCSHCRSLETMIDALLNDHRGQVSVTYHQFPLTDGVARDAALTALCAAAQDRFIEVHRALVAALGVSIEMPPDSVGESLVPDIAAFRQCMGSPRVMRKLARELREGYELGLTETPTLLVNASLVRGAVPRRSLERLIRQSLVATRDR